MDILHSLRRHFRSLRSRTSKTRTRQTLTEDSLTISSPSPTMGYIFDARKKLIRNYYQRPSNSMRNNRFQLSPVLSLSIFSSLHIDLAWLPKLLFPSFFQVVVIAEVQNICFSYWVQAKDLIESIFSCFPRDAICCRTSSIYWENLKTRPHFCCGRSITPSTGGDGRARRGACWWASSLSISALSTGAGDWRGWCSEETFENTARCCAWSSGGGTSRSTSRGTRMSSSRAWSGGSWTGWCTSGTSWFQTALSRETAEAELTFVWAGTFSMIDATTIVTKDGFQTSRRRFAAWTVWATLTVKFETKRAGDHAQYWAALQSIASGHKGEQSDREKTNGIHGWNGCFRKWSDTSSKGNFQKKRCSPNWHSYLIHT